MILLTFASLLFVATVLGGPLRHEDGLSIGQLPQISEFNEHVGRSKILPGLVKTIAMEDKQPQGRFTIPGPIPIDTEQIKKVAQILALLGEQVIPAILGEAKPSGSPLQGSEIPSDGVDEY